VPTIGAAGVVGLLLVDQAGDRSGKVVEAALVG
jgi:hypothetical protein